MHTKWQNIWPALRVFLEQKKLILKFIEKSFALKRLSKLTKKIERKSGLGQRCQYLKCQKKEKKRESQVGGGGVTPVNAQLFGSLVQLCQTRYCQNISTFSVPQCRPAEYLFVGNLLKDINF